MSRCKRCGQWNFYEKQHKCLPCFDVWSNDESYETGRVEIYAIDPQEAVEKWAEINDADSEEYAIVNGDNVTVCVAAPGSDNALRFIVTGESVPQYNARLVTQGEDARR